VVAAAWGRSTYVTNPFLRVHIKMRRTSKTLRSWARGLIGHNKLLLRAASQLIAILDVVQEHRQLSDPEIILLRDLKARFLGITVVEKLRAKQKSRLISIRAEEANEKLFFLARQREEEEKSHSLFTDC
jgi:hypothetical protein